MRDQPRFIGGPGCLGSDARPAVSLEFAVRCPTGQPNNKDAADHHQQSEAAHEPEHDRPWGRFHLRQHPVSLQLFEAAEHAGVGGTIKDFEAEDREAEVEDRSREQWPPPCDAE